MITEYQAMNGFRNSMKY
ncbi:hypothetical protein O9929_14605 [Vibrio lentus]|nr:hypothetical protein [Vibrio lentus]